MGRGYVIIDTDVTKSWNARDCNKLNNSHSNFGHKNNNMSITLLYTTGLHQELYTFANPAEKDAWEAEVFAIKADSSAAFHRKEEEGITSEVRAVYENWKARVIAFKDTYSENRTPQDIKWALNSAEQALGMEVTEWENPPNAALFE